MDNYVDIRGLGRGRYGTARLVRKRTDGRLYAIKKIPFLEDEDRMKALHEAEVLKRLSHQHVVAYMDSFEYEDAELGACLAIVCEYCEEGDLFKRVKHAAKTETPFDQEQIIHWFLQLLAGLDYVHKNRVLHRDLKTQNIFLGEGGILKIGDFGIATVLTTTRDCATTVTGTPYYMAPEVCTHQPYTYKSDVWSMGCVLYELCTLEHAFSADNLLGLVWKIVNGQVSPRIPLRPSALCGCLRPRDAPRPEGLRALRRAMAHGVH
ncbi:hypothetical protein CYMTET_24118 [Cymbomonas tetramitiformis]|uniref:non-specific serine/threonine protein kinase n=1 Tax=Cymbomonas tetramitiformis TaxID=36881 RepID=A0AAE0L095_9CHLO|nr:hypothetical protein CYMTET_24118 [Cymbomonas tetramitiformis]